jgi:hypothetical protein
MQFASSAATTPTGSHDGQGAGDHDMPYTFHRRPTAVWPFPFSERQFVRLLILRSRIQAGLAGLGDLDVTQA